jgi:hypothetical protein
LPRVGRHCLGHRVECSVQLWRHRQRQPGQRYCVVQRECAQRRIPGKEHQGHVQGSRRKIGLFKAGCSVGVIQQHRLAARLHSLQPDAPNPQSAFLVEALAQHVPVICQAFPLASTSSRSAVMPSATHTSVRYQAANISINKVSCPSHNTCGDPRTCPPMPVRLRRNATPGNCASTSAWPCHAGGQLRQTCLLRAR